MKNDSDSRSAVLWCALASAWLCGAIGCVPKQTVVRGPAMAQGPSLAPPELLGDRRKRVEVAYANLRPALAEWSLEADGRDCLLLFSDTQEWLIGCPEMVGQAGFAETGETWEGKKILWNPKSFTTSDSYHPYDEVKLALVGTVGTQSSVDAGKTKLPVLIVQEWDALHKNHPGFQQSGIEEWLGVFVHEAFHARQMWQPRVRSILDRWTGKAAPVGPDELARFYKENEGFRTAVGKEVALLSAAADDSQVTAKKAKSVLSQWLTLYRAREKQFGPLREAAFPGRDGALMDGFETFLEGTARYVEARFLIAPEASSVALIEADPTFTGFKASRGKKPSELPGLGKVGSKYFYSLGMYLAFVLDRAEPNWKSRVFDTDRLLIGEVERVVGQK